MLRGVDPPDLLWSAPLPVSARAVDYVTAITKLPEDPMKRIEFYLDYLEDEDSLLARDAYDEFASAPYGDLKKLQPNLDREQLITWIKDTSLPPDRKRLYLVLLGICGKPEDAVLLGEMLRSDDPNKRAGLDAMIACYVTLLGDDGLKLVDELFLANKQSQYADTYAAIMALRFHGTDGGVISKNRVIQSMQLILQRPELADLVIRISLAGRIGRKSIVWRNCSKLPTKNPVGYACQSSIISALAPNQKPQPALKSSRNSIQQLLSVQHHFSRSLNQPLHPQRPRQPPLQPQLPSAAWRSATCLCGSNREMSWRPTNR